MSFCSHCGKEKSEEAMFCPHCGASSTQIEERKERLSMEDFLAMNSAYQEAKKVFEKKANSRTLVGAFAIIALLGGAIVLSLILLSVPLVFIGFVSIFPLIFVFVSKDNKEKAKLEHYGVMLYKEYLQTNGFSV